MFSDFVYLVWWVFVVNVSPPEIVIYIEHGHRHGLGFGFLNGINTPNSKARKRRKNVFFLLFALCLLNKLLTMSPLNAINMTLTIKSTTIASLINLLTWGVGDLYIFLLCHRRLEIYFAIKMESVSDKQQNVWMYVLMSS